ncbi:YciI family protein, partial [Bacillus sp. S10C12M]|nr:YciI family protein [Bacillus sp. S10C12M]
MNTYLMLTTRTNQFKQGHVAEHYEFLDRLQAEKRLKMFGPFSDATGGAYVIEASSL